MTKGVFVSTAHPASLNCHSYKKGFAATSTFFFRDGSISSCLHKWCPNELPLQIHLKRLLVLSAALINCPICRGG